MFSSVSKLLLFLLYFEFVENKPLEPVNQPLTQSVVTNQPFQSIIINQPLGPSIIINQTVDPSTMNQAVEPSLMDNVKKMCSFRDQICMGDVDVVCTMRIWEDEVQFRNYDNICYLFLSNICDQPGKEFHILWKGNCDSYDEARRSGTGKKAIAQAKAKVNCKQCPMKVKMIESSRKDGSDENGDIEIGDPRSDETTSEKQTSRELNDDEEIKRLIFKGTGLEDKETNIAEPNELLEGIKQLENRVKFLNEEEQRILRQTKILEQLNQPTKTKMRSRKQNKEKTKEEEETTVEQTNGDKNDNVKDETENKEEDDRDDVKEKNKKIKQQEKEADIKNDKMKSKEKRQEKDVFKRASKEEEKIKSSENDEEQENDEILNKNTAFKDTKSSVPSSGNKKLHKKTRKTNEEDFKARANSQESNETNFTQRSEENTNKDYSEIGSGEVPLSASYEQNGRNFFDSKIENMNVHVNKSNVPLRRMVSVSKKVLRNRSSEQDFKSRVLTREELQTAICGSGSLVNFHTKNKATKDRPLKKHRHHRTHYKIKSRDPESDDNSNETQGKKGKKQIKTKKAINKRVKDSVRKKKSQKQEPKSEQLKTIQKYLENLKNMMPHEAFNSTDAKLRHGLRNSDGSKYAKELLNHYQKSRTTKLATTKSETTTTTPQRKTTNMKMVTMLYQSNNNKNSDDVFNQKKIIEKIASEVSEVFKQEKQQNPGKKVASKRVASSARNHKLHSLHKEIMRANTSLSDNVIDNIKSQESGENLTADALRSASITRHKSANGDVTEHKGEIKTPNDLEITIEETIEEVDDRADDDDDNDKINSDKTAEITAEQSENGQSDVENSALIRAREISPTDIKLNATIHESKNRQTSKKPNFFNNKPSNNKPDTVENQVPTDKLKKMNEVLDNLINQVQDMGSYYKI